MKEWFSAAELAAMKLPGLPHRKRNINALAARDHWATALSAGGEALARKGQGQARSGGADYHISLLPQGARSRLVAKLAVPARLDAGSLKDHHAARRDARLFVLGKLREILGRSEGQGRRHGFEVFARSYNAGQIEVPAWVRGQVTQVSRPTLERLPPRSRRWSPG